MRGKAGRREGGGVDGRGPRKGKERKDKNEKIEETRKRRGAWREREGRGGINHHRVGE